MAAKKTSDIKLVRSSDHRSHYIIGAVPQWTEDDLRLHLYNETMEGEGGPYHVTTAQLIIPKTALPRLMEALKKAVRTEGKVVTPEASVLPDITSALDRTAQEKKGTKKKVQKIRRK
jgi:hypothetical protein